MVLRIDSQHRVGTDSGIKSPMLHEMIIFGQVVDFSSTICAIYRAKSMLVQNRLYPLLSQCWSQCSALSLPHAAAILFVLQLLKDNFVVVRKALFST